MLTATLRRALLSVPPRKRDFTRLGFSPGIGGGKLRDASAAFFAGYHAALAQCDLVKLAAALDEQAPEMRGLAYEGAAGALAIMDRLMPWRGDQWRAFLNGPAADHPNMVYAGAGLGLAHLPWVKMRIEKLRRSYIPYSGGRCWTATVSTRASFTGSVLWVGKPSIKDSLHMDEERSTRVWAGAFGSAAVGMQFAWPGRSRPSRKAAERTCGRGRGQRAHMPAQWIERR